MDDIAHIGFVDAHAEGDGRHHHRLVLREELLEPCGAQALVEAGMVGQRRGSGGDQLLGQLVDSIAGTDVDDTGALRPLGH
jgi:hypothetical protein